MVFQRGKRFDENIEHMQSVFSRPMLRLKPGDPLPLAGDNLPCPDDMTYSGNDALDRQLILRSLP